MYNEEKILPSTIKTLHEYMSREFEEYEIIFSDDGSKDSSREIVKTCGLPNIRLVSYGENKGKGGAVRNGMLNAKGDVRLFTDCDIAYGTEIIKTLYNDFKAANCDVMIGSRNIHKDGYEGYTFLRKFVSKAYIKLLCVVGGFKLSDSQCGFKAFSGKAAEVVVSKKLKSHPVCLGVTGPVTIEMEKYFAQMPGDEAMKPKAQRVLELNAAHPVFEKLQKLYGEDKEKAGKLAEVLFCQATLIAGLPIDDPAGYTEIICELV